ncbi:response regulator [Parachitinimonas caeni]|uniref:Response regulator n=1 Tax=Parachitinimonas caeni TaxID=3031301 RepID=A0ABT7DUF8_9NEIS|nr:response regulator [Parachitinimonas caeni]MDK2122723.1 response regulator [Parachitinimonas caeni]
MTEKDSGFSIWVVDDDALQRELISDELIASGYKVRQFESGKLVLQVLEDCQPDLLLLDVVMPEIDGFTVCQQLRALHGHNQVQVIFISASTDYETQMRGYDVGGDDFLSKPVDLEVLTYKVQVAERLYNTRRSLTDDAGQLRDMAFLAMTNAGELGTVLTAMRQFLNAKNVHELARALVTPAIEYGLEGAVRFRGEGGQNLDLSFEGGPCSPLESSILDKMQTQDRIFSFQSRMVVNIGHTTLFLRNMPTQDADRCGRLRDHLALIVEGADHRLDAILAEEDRDRKAAGISRALVTLGLGIDTFRSVSQEVRRSALVLTQDLSDRLTQELVRLGLTDQQEDRLARLISGYAEEMTSLLSRSAEIEASLSETNEVLVAIHHSTP